MDKTHAQATRKRNEQIRRERHERERAEHAAQLAALRSIRDDPKATPGGASGGREAAVGAGKEGIFLLIGKRELPTPGGSPSLLLVFVCLGSSCPLL